MAEDAYTLTATVQPADAANKAIDWSVSFTDSGDEWATGKTVTDYVTVTPTSDGALTAKVENIAAFGEQITVKATSRDNSSAYATCTVEYLQRTTGYTFVLDEKTYNTTGTKTNEATPTFAGTDSASAAITVNKSTVYTRANNDKAEYFTIKPTEEFKTALTEAGITATALKEYSGSASATVTEYFDSAWGAALYGSDNAKKNALIGAIDGFDGNAYEIKVYTENGGSEVATFHITLNASTILGQKGVESVFFIIKMRQALHKHLRFRGICQLLCQLTQQRHPHPDHRFWWPGGHQAAVKDLIFLVLQRKQLRTDRIHFRHFTTSFLDYCTRWAGKCKEKRLHLFR